MLAKPILPRVRSYQDLIVWQKAMDLVVLTYRVTKQLPDDERFGLVSQSRRAAVSVPSNIAEGYGRNRTGDYLRFLSIANGSLKELETDLLIAERLEFLADAAIQSLLNQSDEVSRMLLGLKRSLEARYQRT